MNKLEACSTIVKTMDANLANYLFNKEILYRNAFSEVKPTIVKADVVEKIKITEKPVATPSPAQEIVKPIVPTFVFKHKVLILTDSISDVEKTLLIKILGAIGTSLEQVDLIELSKVHSLDYQSFTSQSITQKVISFGVGLGKLNWNILLNLYQPKNVSGVDFILSDELRVLEENINLKKTLWSALKAMFSN
jgi:DNA polymerase III psi subunit